MVENKEHLTTAGIETIRLLRKRQHINRSFIDPSIIAKVLAIRPEWVNRLQGILAG